MSKTRNRKGSTQTAAMVGSYVPRQCGIATFTKDLRDSVALEIGDANATVLALDDTTGGYPYPHEVRLQIAQHRQADYTMAAELLNINRIDVAFIQHEYGLYGGRDGSHVLDLIHTLRMPVISTLHTVLADPSPSQLAVLKELARESDRVVVMTAKARQLLKEIYRVGDDKIAVIPHGIPDIPFTDPSEYSPQFGVGVEREGVEWS